MVGWQGQALSVPLQLQWRVWQWCMTSVSKRCMLGASESQLLFLQGDSCDWRGILYCTGNNKACYFCLIKLFLYSACYSSSLSRVLQEEKSSLLLLSGSHIRLEYLDSMADWFPSILSLACIKPERKIGRALHPEALWAKLWFSAHSNTFILCYSRTLFYLNVNRELPSMVLSCWYSALGI